MRICKNRTIFVLLGLLAAGNSLTSLGENRETSAVRASVQMLFRPVEVKPEDDFYRKYFKGKDEAIADGYRQSWSYHEDTVQYGLASWRHEFFQIGSLNYYGRAPYEWDVRNGYAESVLRMRAEAAINQYLSSKERSGSIRKAHSLVSSLRSGAVKISSPANPAEPGSPPGEFRIGYDILTDASKFEYTKGSFFAGLYHPGLFGALLGGAPLIEATSLGVSTELGSPILPRASISYTLLAPTVSASLSKALTDRISTQLISYQPISDSGVESYQVQMTYQYRF